MVQPTPRQERLLKRTFVDFTQTSQILQDPLILERGEGLYCWDSEGKRYMMRSAASLSRFSGIVTHG